MTTTERSAQSVGVASAVGAYLLWGLLALYFLLLEPTGAWELVAWRVALSFVFCLILLTVTRGWARVIAILRQPRLAALTALAGALIYVNWQVFVLATLGGNIVETSLGYFINPIATMLLGFFVLHERIRRMQWVAIGITVVAIGVIVFAYGKFPWIALLLTASFGLYGLVKKKIGPSVDAISGLTLESLWLLPVAVVQLIAVGATTGITMGANGPVHALLLSFAGIATAVPLLLFAAGTRRIGLVAIGMIQFITPVMQFAEGVLLKHEEMPPARWIGFAVMWIAIAVFVADLAVTARRERSRSALEATPDPL
ncbi:EamA family transporter RarD [Microbacterium capsulatum]|uniref:EamA family transporter RarD n=1 Tax=Microbacterium capsulatum TaxID=3041921 RepID=A0ABU0XGQ8_9MICO|nr:EamA family transporter RarD [Microbacterium sp. ASV81]MDQ4214317.1 EamA family transporter RarD [Microbacterium sp. ASV81]